MKHYIGIDLGTTNSAICSFDGEKTTVWKSPDQSDVTPSAIYIDRRGNRYYGRRAYEMAPTNEKNAATLFKRYIGTNQTFSFEAADVTFTPEQCSAEILKVLYGYLPEDIRKDPETVTVITVPAAFNQVKKNATLDAAHQAGLGQVALMQEPVAAIMSVMRSEPTEGIFLIYDLGGGTFDVSIAENIGGRVNLLTQGGKEMCGGRDWDRLILDHVIVPWLHATFQLPDNFLSEPQYKLLRQLALFAAEQAKIELSATEESVIRMDESRLRCVDMTGEELYLDIPFSREHLNELIDDLIQETVRITQATMKKAGLTAADIQTIVFVGGPTTYKPLRDKVARELAIATGTNVDPMTAVAEGASIFAESIDWDSQNHNRKATRKEVSATDRDISFLYSARSSSDLANLIFMSKDAQGCYAEITSMDTGWSSGRIPLKDSLSVELPLSKAGENQFEITVYNSLGEPLDIKNCRIAITKTAATVGAIPASHSIGAKVLDKLGGTAQLVFLVHEGDPLPKKGQITFKAGRTLRAGSHAALEFSLWEGDIPYPIEDNRYIGTYRVPGTSIDQGIVPTGADIICAYEVSDDGAIHLGVSIPCVGADFGNQNFYSRQSGQLDLTDDRRIVSDGEKVLRRVDEILEKVDDIRLRYAREKAFHALSLADNPHDEEDVQQAYSDLLDAKKLIAQVRQEHLRDIRQIDLDRCAQFFRTSVCPYATPTETATYNMLIAAAQQSIDNADPEFDGQLDEMGHRNYLILFRQDGFVVDWFHHLISQPHNYADQKMFEALKQQGELCVQHQKYNTLRDIINSLYDIQIANDSSEMMLADVTVIKG